METFIDTTLPASYGGDGWSIGLNHALAICAKTCASINRFIPATTFTKSAVRNGEVQVQVRLVTS